MFSEAYNNFKDIIAKKDYYKSQNNEYIKKADNFIKANNINSSKANAVRHIGASMYFANQYGVNKAKIFGDYSEIAPGSSLLEHPNDTRVDLYNDHIGRLNANKFDNSTMEKSLVNAFNLVLHSKAPATSYQDSRAINFQYPDNPLLRTFWKVTK